MGGSQCVPHLHAAAACGNYLGACEWYRAVDVCTESSLLLSVCVELDCGLCFKEVRPVTPSGSASITWIRLDRTNLSSSLSSGPPIKITGLQPLISKDGAVGPQFLSKISTLANIKVGRDGHARGGGDLVLSPVRRQL